jgi:hypothetical protein
VVKRDKARRAALLHGGRLTQCQRRQTRRIPRTDLENVIHINDLHQTNKKYTLNKVVF